MRLTKIIALIVVLIVGIPVFWMKVVVPGSTMALFKLAEMNTPIRDHVILFSAVNGQMLNHGKPAAGLKIRRSYVWGSEDDDSKPYGITPHDAYAVTDQDGRFHFNEVRGDPKFQHEHAWDEPVVIQDLDWIKGKQQVSLYHNWRNDYEFNSETGYPEITISCDIKTKQEIEDTSFYQLKCDLKEKPSPEKKND